MTGFANTPVDRVSAGGGVVGAVISAAAKQATSTATPCRECYITNCPSLAANSAVMHFAIGTSLLVSLGATVPKSIIALSTAGATPLRVPIDDVSKLWFYATASTRVGVTYRY